MLADHRHGIIARTGRMLKEISVGGPSLHSPRTPRAGPRGVLSRSVLEPNQPRIWLWRAFLYRNLTLYDVGFFSLKRFFSVYRA
jgi:hypothetical protein